MTHQIHHAEPTLKRPSKPPGCTWQVSRCHAVTLPLTCRVANALVKHSCQAAIQNPRALYRYMQRYTHFNGYVDEAVVQGAMGAYPGTPSGATAGTMRAQHPTMAKNVSRLLRTVLDQARLCWGRIPYPPEVQTSEE
jgi:hypothetical protein